MIADDHRLMLAALTRALAVAEDVEIVGEARGGSDVLRLVREARPDVVLLDVRMPDPDGLACLAAIREEFPDVAVLMLTASTDRGVLAGARTGGARGYVVKTARPEELADALRWVASSEEFVTVGMPEGEQPGPLAERLTGREAVVLEGVFRGLTNRQIARSLWVSEQTVKFHLHNVYRKLEVSSRAEAVRSTYGRERVA